MSLGGVDGDRSDVIGDRAVLHDDEGRFRVEILATRVGAVQH
jgi:hypothetical protein